MDSELPPGSCNSTGHLSTLGYTTLPGRMHHSASTPAGVDGVGGGSRTPPLTPKKGGKMLAVRVQMLDDTISIFQIQSKALGQVLFDQVCRQLHLLEADYFGLEYQDANGTRYWLEAEKPMCRQLGLSSRDAALRLCVKFYTPEPARLHDEFTRYLFCLQVKRDLARGDIRCNTNTAALMASYIVQAECGDFVPEDYPDHTYLSGYKFFPGQDADAEQRIMENHKKHIGQSPAEADLNLLETARRCELYGIKMHPAKDHEGSQLNLAVGHMGIVVFQGFTKINTFSWAKIRKISFKRKKFLIKLHPEGYGYLREVVEFFLEGRNECKNFWKKCVEHHGFFRCSSAPRAPRRRAAVVSRGSSFRYSGKTQKQIVEFVRDNYVQRQTFQRWGSAGRGAGRAERGERAATLPASVSAHPLLPLPPGSDAISLEWEQQPQYAEAALMMRGYTPEGAREAAARPPSRHRPAAPATAYAATRDRPPPGLVTRAEVNPHLSEDSFQHHQTTQSTTQSESIWKEANASHTRAGSRTAESAPLPVEVDVTVTEAAPAPTPDRPASPTLPASPTPPVSPTLPASPTSPAPPVPADVSSQRSAAGNDSTDAVNGNVVESAGSLDVLSGCESDADTLSRKNNNSISGRGRSLWRGGRGSPPERLHCAAKELLMTERTYKRDLELVTVTWAACVSRLAEGGAPVAALARASLALGPLALAHGALLLRLERALLPANDNEESEYKRIPEIFFDYLSSSHESRSRYRLDVGALVGGAEGARRRGAGGGAARAAASFDAASPLPLACLLLRPLHRDLYYEYFVNELEREGFAPCARLRREAEEAAAAARDQLRHVENHALLCQLQRDLIGYDKLLVADREFVRLGCVFRHSPKGLSQRMIFLFDDVCVTATRCASGRYRALAVIPLGGRSIQVRPADAASHPPHTLTISGEDLNLTLSCGDEVEFEAWQRDLRDTLARAAPRPRTDDVDVALGGIEDDEEVGSGGGLSHVCWHRAASLGRDHFHLALRSQMSGHLLRKFKSSPGWQRLWVVLAALTLFFYKEWTDDAPLASLPLLRYKVGPTVLQDGIDKPFAFKLQYKSHLYFFRAESYYACNRWIEVLQAATEPKS